MLTLELKRKFVVLAFKLSDENISCDGECSRAEIQQKYNQYTREWGRLERLANCRVDEEEPFKWIEELKLANLNLY